MVASLNKLAIHVVLALLVASIALPFLYLLAVSLTNETIVRNMSLSKVSFGAYEFLFRSSDKIVASFRMSVLRTVLGTVCNMLVSIPLAYSLSKKHLPGRKAMMVYIVITMVFHGGLIPTYITVTSLGLVNSIWAMILPALVSAYNVILLRNFFMAIPPSLEESARIDGASDYAVLRKVVLPLSTPVLATISLFYAVYHWNEWFNVLLYIRKSDMWTMQVLLRNIVMEASAVNELISMDTAGRMTPESIKVSTLLVTIFPIVLLYPFVQRYFIQGVMLGAVKE
jgi:putative aldouronate transport system permease protein